jgi:hypothetical protein
MPSQCVAQGDFTAQSAAIATTTIFTTVQPGVYRFSWTAKKTTADGVSSTLGALTLVHTHVDNTSMSISAPFFISAGTLATTNATDSATVTGACFGIPVVMNCKAATVITVAMAYISNTPGNMIYDFHWKLERNDVN